MSDETGDQAIPAPEEIIAANEARWLAMKPCLFCGEVQAHEHSWVDVVIYRNGLKAGAAGGLDAAAQLCDEFAAAASPIKRAAAKHLAQSIRRPEKGLHDPANVAGRLAWVEAQRNAAAKEPS